MSGNGLSDVLHTRRGTLAGMALADLAFILASANLLRALEARLREEGILQDFALSDSAAQLAQELRCDAASASPLLTTYMDDLVVPFAASAEVSERRSSQLRSSLSTRMRGTGFVPRRGLPKQPPRSSGKVAGRLLLGAPWLNMGSY